jgi:hypothetical protein
MKVQWNSRQVLIGFKKASCSFGKEVLYNIIIEFGVPMELVRLIKMCLNDTYSKVHTNKHLSFAFRFHNGLIQGDALKRLLQKFLTKYFKFRRKPGGLNLNGRFQILVYAVDVNLLVRMP